MRLFDDATQQEIVALLRQRTSVGGVRFLEGVRYWTPIRDIEGRPLVDFINQEMEPVAERGGYEVLRRKTE
jgi:hypothetical protein